MNYFERMQEVERRGRAYLEPYLKEMSTGVVNTDKGSLSKFMQESYGDYFANMKPTGEFVAIETKCEEFHTNNIYLETWSWKARGRRGWMHKLKCDLLWSFFLDKLILYQFPFPSLRTWLTDDDECRNFPEKVCSAFERGFQKNDTWGRCVPARWLLERFGGKRYQFPPDDLMAGWDSHISWTPGEALLVAIDTKRRAILASMASDAGIPETVRISLASMAREL